MCVCVCVCVSVLLAPTLPSKPTKFGATRQTHDKFIQNIQESISSQRVWHYLQSNNLLFFCFCDVHFTKGIFYHFTFDENCEITLIWSF